LDGHLYLIEAKWWGQNLGTGEVSQHTVRVASRSGMRGLYVVQPGYTDAAVTTIRDALQRGVFVLATVEELVVLLESDDSIADWLREKVRYAMIDRDPFRPRLRRAS
jgi:restriction system protein